MFRVNTPYIPLAQHCFEIFTTSRFPVDSVFPDEGNPDAEALAADSMSTLNASTELTLPFLLRPDENRATHTAVSSMHSHTYSHPRIGQVRPELILPMPADSSGSTLE